MSSAKFHAITIHAIPPVRQKEECANSAIEIGRVKITEAERQVRRNEADRMANWRRCSGHGRSCRDHY